MFARESEYLSSTTISWFRVRALDRGYAVNMRIATQFYAASCIRTSENSSTDEVRE
jgi:hypothetical protein